MTCPECKDGGDVIESGGELVCTQCALVLGSHFSKDMPPKWYGTHSIVYKAQFKPENHMEKPMKPLLGRVSHAHYSAMKAVFGRIYKSFFKVSKAPYCVFPADYPVDRLSVSTVPLPSDKPGSKPMYPTKIVNKNNPEHSEFRPPIQMKVVLILPAEDGSSEYNSINGIVDSKYTNAALDLEEGLHGAMSNCLELVQGAQQAPTGRKRSRPAMGNIVYRPCFKEGCSNYDGSREAYFSINTNGVKGKRLLDELRLAISSKAVEDGKPVPPKAMFRVLLDLPCMFVVGDNYGLSKSITKYSLVNNIYSTPVPHPYLLESEPEDE
eukprot:jgi/Tetstr1/459317/TSEL_004712.t1